MGPVTLNDVKNVAKIIFNRLHSVGASCLVSSPLALTRQPRTDLVATIPETVVISLTGKMAENVDLSRTIPVVQQNAHEEMGHDRVYSPTLSFLLFEIRYIPRCNAYRGSERFLPASSL